MRRAFLIIAALAFLSGCGASVSLGAVWHFGDGSSAYGNVSITNDLGAYSRFYIGTTVYGPIGDGDSIIIQLRPGYYSVRDSYGHSRQIYIVRSETIFIIFG
ncbi:hypothetical protein J7K50_00250 [bacterium]|nr:hypothetical protein [bacterium]